MLSWLENIFDNIGNFILDWIDIDQIHADSTRYHGLLDRARNRDYQVIYPDGKRSVAMPYGNACDYRDIFGGTVVKVDK